MKAHARLTAELDAGTGRTVLRELTSMAPLTLFPKRGGRAARVHLVNSATTPLGGDELLLTVRVGPGATVNLSGVAATLALPGQNGEASSATTRFEIAEGGCVEYLPEATVVTARARHTATLSAELAPDARFRAREVLVLGRSGECPGSLTTYTQLTRAGVPLLRQQLAIGDAELHRSPAYLAGRRVLATEILVWGEDPAEPVSGDWWSLTPLAAGGCLATALAADAVTAMRDLDTARLQHPAWSR
ncbi:urease accessory protein UreD [Saccharomonospora sp. NPDC046836]|uniref:urease accessory protein UreD n=1 Tax=Saccharomonospora sp. NPDC046836 TaxID=3156921 RepID=UPI0033DBEC2A